MPKRVMDLPDHQQVARAHRRDVALAVVVFLVCFALGAHFDLFEKLYQSTREHEEFELDEALIALGAALIALSLYSFRRSLAFRREHTARLEAYHDLLKEMNETGLVRLSLDQARRDSTAARRSKSAFLAHMSHEMRTPLNAIVGFAQMLNREEIVANPDRRSAYAGHILESGNQLLETIDTLLELSDASEKGLELTETELDAGRFVAACVDAHRPQAGPKRIGLHVTAPERPLTIRADENRLRLLLHHLIMNAIKYTPEEGAVQISVERSKDGKIRFYVLDTGRGMTAGQIEAAGRTFAHSDGLLAKKPEQGMGLGLPLCRAIAVRHGGTLDFESRSGAGTAVTLTLPASRIVERAFASQGATALGA